MALKGDAHAMRRKLCLIGERRRRAAQHQRHTIGGGLQRGKLRPIGHTGIEQRIGAGFRIGAGARHGFIQAEQVNRAGARHNDQARIFPRGKRRMDFAEPGIQAEQARFARAMCAGQVCVFNGEG